MNITKSYTKSPETIIDYNVSTCFGSHTIHWVIEKVMYTQIYYQKKKKLNLSFLTHLNIKLYNQNIAFKPNNRNINIEWTTKWDQKWKISTNVTQNSIQTILEKNDLSFNQLRNVINIISRNSNRLQCKYMLWFTYNSSWNWKTNVHAKIYYQKSWIFHF